ncbi:MAG: hypothetical protein GY711_01785 [bacterium]|nr:hypothetical protein [bacterium]
MPDLKIARHLALCLVLATASSAAPQLVESGQQPDVRQPVHDPGLGTVVFPSGGPAAFVWVREHGAAGAFSTRTDANGRFRLRPADGVDHVLTIDGFERNGAGWTLQPYLTSGTRPVVLTLRQGGSVSGKWTDGRGRSVPEFEVVLIPTEPRPDVPSELGGDDVRGVRRQRCAGGRFSVLGLEPGGWRVLARAKGYLQAEATSVVVLEKGQVVRGVRLRAGQLASIHGEVRVPGGGPVQEGFVSAESESQRWGAELVEGRFESGSIAPGRYRIEVRFVARDTAGRLRQYITETDVLLAEAERRSLSLVGQRMPAIRVFGRVHGAGEGADGGSVSISGGPFGHAVLSADGRFEVLVEAAGEYTLQVSLELDGTWHDTAYRVRVLDVPDLEFDVSLPQATVSGRVIDAQGRPVSGVGLDLFAEDPRFATCMSATTDASGRFRFSHVPDATYLLGYPSSIAPETGTVEDFAISIHELHVEHSRAHSGLELRLTAGGSVRGRVFDEAGLPIAFGSVYLLDPGDGTSRPFEGYIEDGCYEFVGLSPGPKRIFGRSVGRSVLAARATVRAGAAVECDLVLEPSGALLVAPNQSAKLEVLDEDGVDCGALTDSWQLEGGIQFVLPPGTYRVRSTLRSGGTVERVVDVVAGEQAIAWR